MRKTGLKVTGKGDADDITGCDRDAENASFGRMEPLGVKDRREHS